MKKAKPFVAIATLCEKVLQESDGIMSAIRIVDTFIATRTPGAPLDARPVLPITGLVALKSGSVRGSHTLELVLNNPKGEQKPISPENGWPVVFQGDEQGVQIKLEYEFEVEHFGLFWIDLLFDGEVLTSIPLRLRLAERQDEETASSPTVSR